MYLSFEKSGKCSCKKSMKLIWKPCHRGRFFLFSFCVFLFCKRFFSSFIVAVLRSLKVCQSALIFFSSFDIGKHVQCATFAYNTLQGTHNMINFKDAIIYSVLFSDCFDFSSSFTSSHPHRSLILSSHFHSCGFLYVGNMKNQLIPLMLFLFMICKFAKKNEKIKYYNRTRERGEQPFIIFVLQMELKNEFKLNKINEMNSDGKWVWKLWINYNNSRANLLFSFNIHFITHKYLCRWIKKRKKKLKFIWFWMKPPKKLGN